MKKIIVIVLPLLALIAILSIFFDLRQVKGQSMEPSVPSGTYLLFKKLLGNSKLYRSDVVIYDSNQYIGRIIGLPNEKVRVQDGALYLDTNEGEKYKLIEDYIPSNRKTTVEEENQWITIPLSSYLILRDKRDMVSLEENIIPVTDIQEVLFIPLTK